MSVIPVDLLNKLKAVIRKIEMTAAFDGQEPHVFNELIYLNSLKRNISSESRFSYCSFSGNFLIYGVSNGLGIDTYSR